MNLLEQIAYHLEFCGFGYVATEEVEGNIFWGRMPDKPDDAICVFSSDSATPGSKDGARIQIINRSVDTREAYETSYQIAEELEDFRGFLNGDGSDVFISVVNSANGLGADAKKRELYSTNIRVTYCL